MFLRIASAPRDVAGTDLDKLTAELVQHETAEELEVYPALCDGNGAERMIIERLEEHAALEHEFASLAKMRPHERGFADAVARVDDQFAAHASAEERLLLPLLVNLPSEERVAIAERYLASKRAAPTRPHPHAPGAPRTNRLVDSLAAVVDRVRDAAAGRT